MLKIVRGEEIAFAETDVIVNAANGCGWMGGKRCHTELHKGVAEHLNYYTHGAIENKALIAARKYSKITSWLFGTKAGDFFVTESCGLKCQKIIHAVTMRYPASYSSIKDVSDVIKKIFEYCHNSNYKSIAIPCLGCGTGGLQIDKVMELIRNETEFYPKINIMIYLKK